MPIINKFGLSRHHRDRGSGGGGELALSKTVERILRQGSFVSLNEDGNLEVGGRRIVNVGHPIAGSDGANKKFVEATVWSAFDRYPEEDFDVKNHRIKNVASPIENTDGVNKETLIEAVRSAFEAFPETGIDVKNKRIANLGLPLSDNDAASKIYVDRSLYGGGYSILILNLRADESDWYLIEPYGKHEFEFPFDADVRLNDTDLVPSEVVVYRDDDGILERIFDGTYHLFFKGSRMSFRRSGDKQKAYVELVYRSTA